MRPNSKGFSIPELMIVMTMLGILSTILLLMYGQSRQMLSRGMILTELEQRARLLGGRLIPKLASGCLRPAVDLNADNDTDDAGEAAVAIKFPPAPPLPTPLPANLNPPREVQMFGTREYVETQLRHVAPTPFNPREPEFREFRVFFVSRNVDIEKFPDGKIGDVFIDGNTSGNTSDDIRLATGIRDLRFDREPNNVIRLSISVKAYDPYGSSTTTNRATLSRQHVTKVYLPILTHQPGP